jgi:hypothetical protein
VVIGNPGFVGGGRDASGYATAAPVVHEHEHVHEDGPGNTPHRKEVAMDAFRPVGVVTLTTDFGTLDGYVGAMKGVILSRFPQARLVDITHDVPPQDVRAAARALAKSTPHFPVGCVHVAVVDPGVGTARAPLVVQHEGQLWVAPDNGVLSRVVPREATAWRIERPDLMLSDVSRTFHGRDVFAPAAAALAAGSVQPAEVGPRHTPMWLPPPELHRGLGVVRGEVVAVDRFGNVVSNVPLTALSRDVELGRVVTAVGEVRVTGIAWSYGDVEPGEWVVVVGSGDTLELSVRDGSAAARGGLRVGDSFRVELPRS